MTLVGTSVPRLEDHDLLRGKARFVDDISFPGMLHAAFVRSPHGHAAIRGIDASTALALPGVAAVYSARDFAPHLKTDRLIVGLPSPSYRQDINRPVLAGDETVHVGEAVAIVLASSRYVAEDAAALVDIDYDPLPAVADARAALQPDAPKVHRASPHNLLAEFDMAYGDVAAAFAAAPHVFRESLWQHRGAGHSIECRGGVARYDSVEDRVTLWSSTQTPHTARQILCEILGRDDDKVRVITPDIGGGFGPKLIFYPEDAALCLAALLLQRPVKWIEDRREHFVATTQERDQYWDIEIAADRDGYILGVRGSLVHEHGAYTARGANLPYESAQTVTLPYKVPAYALNVKLALTNKVPVTPVRGAGQAQGVFAMERLLDRVARELGLDRAEVRGRNLVPGSEMPYRKPLKSRGGMQVVLDSGDYPKCHAIALEAIGWDGFPARQRRLRAEGRYAGVGIANFVKGTGRGPFEAVSIRIGLSGKVHVATGGAAIGQGTRTMLAQIVADELGGDLDNILVTTGDTGAVPMGMGSFNSRLAPLAGSSALLAARRLREKVLTIAAQMLQMQAGELEIAGAIVRRKGSATLSVPLSKIARSVVGTAGFTLPDNVTPGLEELECFVRDEMTYANGTAAAEVEVDIETGEVFIRNFVIVHDCGRVIHPQVVDGQILGAVAHGIGNAFYEWMGFDENCQPVTATLADYLMITAAEMPRIDIRHMESPTGLNPLGAKGVGECGVLPASPALMAAVEDALSPFGVRITRTPMAPGEILALVEAGRRGSLGHSL